MRACDECGWAGLPERRICPRCSGLTWIDTSHVQGTVIAMTPVHRSFGHTFIPPQFLALVSVTNGGSIVASGREPIPVGTQVSVDAQLRIDPLN